jgi:hypothetical protein
MHQMIDDNRVWFGSNGKSAPAIKRFLTEVKQALDGGVELMVATNWKDLKVRI